MDIGFNILLQEMRYSYFSYFLDTENLCRLAAIEMLNEYREAQNYQIIVS